MKKCVSILACLIASVAYAGDNNGEVMKQIELLQQQIAQQQQMIDALRAQMQAEKPVSNEQVTEMVKSEVATAVKAGLADVSSGPTISLGKGIDGLKLKGDLRLRYEQIDVKDDTPGSDDDVTANRFRVRFRVGGVWTNSTESWEIGAGLATGGQDATSTNDSWGENGFAFETGDIRLDYAYAKHTWKDYGLSLTLGQMVNPFETTWILWDSDVRPTGAALHLDQDLFFLTAGVFNVYGDRDVDGGDPNTTETVANMYAAQVGAKMSLSENVAAKLALGFYQFDAENTEYEFAQNSNADNLDYQYSIADLYGEITAKINELSLKGYGQYCVNMGAESSDTISLNPTNIANADAGYDAEDEDTAWLLGVEGKLKNFKLTYEYAHIEGDAVYADINDGDFGAAFAEGSRNVEGHKISLGYSITKNFSAGVTAIFAERISAAANQDDEMALYQLDLGYKF